MTPTEQQAIFDTWLQEHKGLFFKVVRSYAFNENDQDDLFQEICLNVWQSIPSFRGEAKASTWIYRVALFSAMAWSRREKADAKRTQAIGPVEHALTATGDLEDDQVAWLYAQIGQLDVFDRSIALLLLEGYRYKEIAELVGISASNVGVRIHRIKQRLVRASKEVTNHGV